MKKQFLLFLYLFLFSIILSACAPQESTVLNLKEPVKDPDTSQMEQEELLNSDLEEIDEPQTVIPVVGKEEDANSDEMAQIDDSNSSANTEKEYDSSQDIYPDRDTPTNEDEPIDTDSDGDMPTQINSQVGVSVNYIYELYQDDLGEDILDLRISMPQVYYSDGIPLQNANTYYTQYLDAYRTKIETETLEVIMESPDAPQESRLSTVEMNFSVTYNDDWLLSIAMQENVCVLGERAEHSNGQTFDTQKDVRLSLWDLLSQTDVQDTILLPAVQQVLDTLKVNYDAALLVSQLDFYSFTLDTTGITLYIACETLDPAVQQTAQVFFASSNISDYLQQDYSTCFQPTFIEES